MARKKKAGCTGAAGRGRGGGARGSGARGSKSQAAQSPASTKQTTVAATAANKIKKGNGYVQIVSTDEAALGPEKKARRQLERRDTDEQVHRYIKRKLNHIDPARLKVIRTEDNQNLREYITAEIKDKRCHQGRLSSDFAVRLHQDFGLTSEIWQELDKPSADVECHEELSELVMLCHDENKFDRETTPLVNFLNTCPQLDRDNYLSLLLGSLPGPLLDELSSEKIQVAIVKWVAKHRMDVEHPDIWIIVRGRLDSSYKKTFERDMVEGVQLKTFLKNNRKIVQLFVAPEVVDRLVECDGKFKGMGKTIATMMTSDFSTGEAMFKDYWLGCANEIYEQEIATMLFDLEHNDFEEDEIESYRNLLRARATNLKKMKDVKKLKWRYTFRMHDDEISPMDLDNPADAAEFALANRMKSIAVLN